MVYRQVAELMASTGQSAVAFNGRGTADPWRSTTPGLVYFMRFGDRVKIGFTTNLKNRSQAIPHDEVMATMPGTMRDEKALHARFAKHRIHHEWFDLAPEVADFIASIKRAA